MAIPVVPVQTPDQQQIDLPDVINPYLSVWWTAQTITNIPESVMGWLVAQGWEITGVTADETTSPPTNTFALQKDGMQPLQVLLSLCNSYTIAANDAREANEIRYNQIVDNWTDLIASSQTHFDAQTTEQNTAAGVYLQDASDFMDEVDAMIAENKLAIETAATAAGVSLEAMDTKLADLETNALATASTVESLLTSQDGFLGTFVTDFTAKLGELDTNYAAHVPEITALLTDSDTSLSTFLSDQAVELSQLETEQADAKTEILSLLAGEVTSLASHLADYAVKLAEPVASGTTMRSAIDTIITDRTDALTDYLTDYATQIAHLATDFTAHQIAALTKQSGLSSDLDSHVLELTDELTTAATNADEFVTDVAAQLASMLADFDAMDADLDTVLADVTTVSDSHASDYEGVLDLLETDFLTHSITATNFLTDLGATELARINEQFASTLSVQLQKLVDDGLYTSAVASDVTARNHRDRDEQIQALNDRLMREKHENQHRLYGQQLSMRVQTLSGKDRIHAVRQEVLRYRASQVTGTYALLQEVRNRTVAGKQAILAAREANSRLEIEVRSGLYQFRDALIRWSSDDTHRLYGEQLNTRLQAAAAEDRKHAVRQEVLTGQATLRMQVQESLIREVAQQLEGLDRQRAATTDIARLGITVQQQLFAAIQGVLSQILDRIERRHGLSVDVWRNEAQQRDRLLEQVQQIETQQLAGIDRTNAAQQDVSRVAMAQRNTLLAQLQDAAKGIITGKERHSALTMQQASVLAEHRSRAVAEKMNTSAVRLDAWKSVSQENQRLLAYQLDERNKLIIGLYSFVERREDIGPEWRDMASLIAGLGDSAGGWIQP